MLDVLFNKMSNIFIKHLKFVAFAPTLIFLNIFNKFSPSCNGVIKYFDVSTKNDYRQTV